MQDVIKTLQGLKCELRMKPQGEIVIESKDIKALTTAISVLKRIDVERIESIFGDYSKCCDCSGYFKCWGKRVIAKDFAQAIITELTKRE